jgi:hypothetical protein
MGGTDVMPSVRFGGSPRKVDPFPGALKAAEGVDDCFIQVLAQISQLRHDEAFLRVDP